MLVRTQKLGIGQLIMWPMHGSPGLRRDTCDKRIAGYSNGNYATPFPDKLKVQGQSKLDRWGYSRSLCSLICLD